MTGGKPVSLSKERDPSANQKATEYVKLTSIFSTVFSLYI